jgi:hypothetical protein
MDALFAVVDHLVRDTAELLALCADHDDQRPWIDHTDVLLFTSIRKLPYDYMGLFEKRKGKEIAFSDDEDISESEEVNVDENHGAGFSMPGDGTAWQYSDLNLGSEGGRLEMANISKFSRSRNCSMGSGQKPKKRKRAELQTGNQEGATSLTNELSPNGSEAQPGKVKLSKAERRQLMKQRRHDKKMKNRLAKQKQEDDMEKTGDDGVLEARVN